MGFSSPIPGASSPLEESRSLSDGLNVTARSSMHEAITRLHSRDMPNSFNAATSLEPQWFRLLVCGVDESVNELERFFLKKLH